MRVIEAALGQIEGAFQQTFGTGYADLHRLGCGQHDEGQPVHVAGLVQGRGLAVPPIDSPVVAIVLRVVKSGLDKA